MINSKHTFSVLHNLFYTEISLFTLNNILICFQRMFRQSGKSFSYTQKKKKTRFSSHSDRFTGALWIQVNCERPLLTGTQSRASSLMLNWWYSSNSPVPNSVRHLITEALNNKLKQIDEFWHWDFNRSVTRHSTSWQCEETSVSQILKWTIHRLVIFSSLNVFKMWTSKG